MSAGREIERGLLDSAGENELAGTHGNLTFTPVLPVNAWGGPI